MARTFVVDVVDLKVVVMYSKCSEIVIREHAKKVGANHCRHVMVWVECFVVVVRALYRLCIGVFCVFSVFAGSRFMKCSHHSLFVAIQV